MNPVRALYQDELLRQNGVSVEGVIINRRTSTAKTTSYYITYGYSAANQQFHTQEVHVSENTYASHPEGMPVSVVYLPSDPNVSMLTGEDADYSERNKVLLFGLGWLGIAFIGLSAAIWKMREQRLWVQKSRIMQGIVCESQGHQAGEKLRYFKLTIRYRFVSPSGIELFGRQSEARDDLAYQALPKPGTPVAVLYLDDKHYKML
jgi:hypothetical protein